jgi:16S rRNA G966 N2-methylase RsmD
MANISKIKRDRMLKYLESLKAIHNDDESIKMFNEIEDSLTEKKYGLVFEEHTEQVDEMLENNIPILTEDKDRVLIKDKSKPVNFIIEGDNLQALYLLEKTHRGKVDCIYIDPPYNSGAHDWKYNNKYVDETDSYCHSKWLSMMKRRLQLAKVLLNPQSSILIVTIDEKEYLHLGCLLEELFENASIQMISSVINRAGTGRKHEFSRTDEYLFFVRIGDASISYDLTKGENVPVVWDTLRRSGPTNTRDKTKKQFYPVFVNNLTKKIDSIGTPLSIEQSINDVIAPNNCTAVFPIRDNGMEMMWGCVGEEFIKRLKSGYIRVGKYTPDKPQKYVISYLTEGIINDINNGKAFIESYLEDGSVNAFYKGNKEIPPTTNWNRPSHDAQWYGSKIIKQLLGPNRFPYPKSLYAVKDCLYYAVKDKKDAIIIDFFSGSGTTLHAINLLNAEDGGNRKCIMVTNNEISESEEKAFNAIGIKKGDVEWENKGIAKYVTWPRTICSINGKDIYGKNLEGNYGVQIDDYILEKDIKIIDKKSGASKNNNYYKKVKTELYPALSRIKLSDGFMCNVKYLKCDWTPRKPDDHLLSNVLMMHVKEMIELQNFIEIDNKKNVLILNKDDVKKYLLDCDKYKNIEEIWINQNIVLNSVEMKLLKQKDFKYVPKEFFGDELKEAAE